MSFFNKKEDVIEIQLTQYGKHLLSKGRFKPAYYAFYDDDIIYDSSYAGMTEDQNDIQQRIEDTPRLKTQYVFSSLETNRLVEHIRTDAAPREAMQSTSEKHYGLASQIGTSAIGKSYAPAWNISFLKGKIQSSATHISNEDGTGRQRLPIPQIEPETIKYTTQVKIDKNSSQVGLVRPTGEDFLAGDVGIDEPFSDGSYIDIEEEYILLNVDEINTDFSNDNFDIEVFEVEDEGLATETLIPLRFIKKPELIKNGILLDEPDHPEGDIFSNIDPTYVEYWFDIFCDSEIDNSVLCDVQKGTPRANIFTQDALDCPEDKDVEFQDILTEEEDEC